jgi:DNA topoisomerase IB
VFVPRFVEEKVGFSDYYRSLESAKADGLHHVSDTKRGTRRKRSGRWFRYIDADGKSLINKDTLARIKSLAIPPAWTQVWICPSAKGHLQAVGRGAKGRKPSREVRDETNYELFQYVDRDGIHHSVDSADVNEYRYEITNQDFTAKDFRTWAGSVLAREILRELATFESEAEAKRNVVQAIKQVSARLGNTPAVCRRCYVHPIVIAAR